MDAQSKVLGRLASEIARHLRGKHKPIFTPRADTGDFIVVVNADKVSMTGSKRPKKTYYRHSGYLGGLKHYRGEALPEETDRSAPLRRERDVA